jgi:hypothetical protein
MHASSVHPRRIRARPAVYIATTTHFRNALDATIASSPRCHRAAADLLVSERSKTQVRPRRPLGRPVEEDAGRPEEERTIPASRGAAAPSRHRRDSYPSDEVVGGFFSILRPFGPRRATAMLRAGRRQQAQVPQGRGPGRRRQGVPRGSREEADILPRRRGQLACLRHGPQVGQGQVRRVHEGGLRRVARQGRQEAAEPDVLSARCARRPLTYDLSNI